MPRAKIETIFANDKSTIEWLRSQKRNTRYSYTTYWSYFLEYTKMTGDQILEDRKQDASHKYEKLTMNFRKWAEKNKSLSENASKTACATVRSFFNFHYEPLNFRRADAMKLSEASRQTEDFLFDIEHIKAMNEVADIKQKYILLAGKSFGLRASDFLELTRGDFTPYINKEPPIYIGQKTTQKEKIVANLFIDRDAKAPIKAMLKLMQKEGRTSPTDKILDYKDEQSLTNNLKDLMKRANIDTGSKAVRFHNLRKFLIDRLSIITSESKWKQIIGKKVSEDAYVSELELREIYDRVQQYTCIKTNGITKKVEFQEKVISGHKQTISKLIERQNSMRDESQKQQEAISDLINVTNFLKAEIKRLKKPET